MGATVSALFSWEVLVLIVTSRVLACLATEPRLYTFPYPKRRI